MIDAATMRTLTGEAEQRAQQIPAPTSDDTGHRYRAGDLGDYFTNQQRRDRLERRRASEANRPTGTELNQTTSKVAAQATDLQALVAAALSVTTGHDSTEGKGIPAANTWTTLCSLSIPTPDNRNTASFQATGTATLRAASAMTEMGYRLRLTIDGIQVATTIATRENSESDEWEALVTGTLNLAGLTGPTEILLQALAEDAAAWPDMDSDTATLNVQAAFPAPAGTAAAVTRIMRGEVE